MATKAFGVKELKIDGSGTPTIESPSGGNLNITAATATFSGNLAVNGNLTVSGSGGGGGGSSTFLSLTDTPANYTSQAGKILKVNTGATALEFSDVEAITISTAESTDDNNTYNIPFLTSTGAGGAQKGLQVDNGGLWFNPGTNYFGVQNVQLGFSNNIPGALYLWDNTGRKMGQINGISFGPGNNASQTTNVIIGQTSTGTAIGGLNVAIGYGAFSSSGTNAQYNVALGFQALLGNNGAYNVALGDNALSGPGSYNIGIGRQAGHQINGGQFNVFVGHQCARAATTIGHSFAVGYNALDSITDGNISPSGDGNTYGHIAIGLNSQKQFGGVDTLGSPNISMGIYSLEENIQGNANIAIGNLALQWLGKGATDWSNSQGGIGNIAIGQETCKGGYNGSYSNTSTFRGDYNTAVGHGALQILQGPNCDKNTGIGLQAGNNITTGSNNTCIGSLSDASSSTVSNEITLGDSNISSLRCNDQSISALSDGRDKTDIVDLPVGLDLIKNIRPVKFKWQRREPDANDGKIRAGFIAQELQEAQIGSEYLNLIYDENPEKLEAKQGNLIPVLVQAIKELSTKNDALEARIAALES